MTDEEAREAREAREALDRAQVEDRIKERERRALENPPKPPLEGYGELYDILMEAFKQSAQGKGAERHGKDGLPWTQQPIIQNQKDFGVGFALGQVSKKIKESMELDVDKAIHELRGAIIYTAGAIYYLEQFKRHGHLRGEDGIQEEQS
jgi:hypothetical protein